MFKNNEHLLKVDALICDLYYGQHYNALGLHLSDRAEIIEKIIIKSSSNRIPKDAKILNDIFNMCVDAQNMRSSLDSTQLKSFVRKLCRTWAVNKSDAIFKGAIKDLSGNIQVKLEINVPILDLIAPILKKYKVTNLGFYAKNEKLELILPKIIYKLKDNDNFHFSQNNDLILKNQNLQLSTCVSEIFRNGTTSSCQVNRIPSTCIVKPFKNSFLTCFNGTYREHRATKLIKHTGSLMVHSGEIFCSDGTYIEMIHRNNKPNYTDLYEWHATLYNLTYFRDWNTSDSMGQSTNTFDSPKNNTIYECLVWLSLVLNFLMIGAFTVLVIKIFGFTNKPDVIEARPKTEVLNFPQPDLKPRPKSEYLGARP